MRYAEQTKFNYQYKYTIKEEICIIQTITIYTLTLFLPGGQIDPALQLPITLPNKYQSYHVEIFLLFLKIYFTTLDKMPGFKTDCLSFQALPEQCIFTCWTKSLILPPSVNGFLQIILCLKAHDMKKWNLPILLRKFAQFCANFCNIQL